MIEISRESFARKTDLSTTMPNNLTFKAGF